MITLNSGFEASAVLASVSPFEINRITENITVTLVLQEKCLLQFFQLGKFLDKRPTKQTYNKRLDNSLIIGYLLCVN